MNSIILKTLTMAALMNVATLQGEVASVQAIGDLRLIRSNALTDSVPLGNLRREHLFGLGMPKGLDQELLIIDGQEYTGRFRNLRYKATPAADDLEVSFLVYGYIPKWREIALPRNVKTFAELEHALPRIIRQQGMDPNVTTPFRLEAQVDGLKWFVVNGMGNGVPDYEESFLRSRFLGGFDGTAIEGFGIFSPDKQGVWTSPTSKVHFHFRTKSGQPFVGHLNEEVFIREGAVLSLPVGTEG